MQALEQDGISLFDDTCFLPDAAGMEDPQDLDDISRNRNGDVRGSVAPPPSTSKKPPPPTPDLQANRYAFQKARARAPSRSAYQVINLSTAPKVQIVFDAGNAFVTAPVMSNHMEAGRNTFEGGVFQISSPRLPATVSLVLGTPFQEHDDLYRVRVFVGEQECLLPGGVFMQVPPSMQLDKTKPAVLHGNLWYLPPEALQKAEEDGNTDAFRAVSVQNLLGFLCGTRPSLDSVPQFIQPPASESPTWVVQPWTEVTRIPPMVCIYREGQKGCTSVPLNEIAAKLGIPASAPAVGAALDQPRRLEAKDSGGSAAATPRKRPRTDRRDVTELEKEESRRFQAAFGGGAGAGAGAGGRDGSSIYGQSSVFFPLPAPPVSGKRVFAPNATPRRG